MPVDNCKREEYLQDTIWKVNSWIRAKNREYGIFLFCEKNEIPDSTGECEFMYTFIISLMPDKNDDVNKLRKVLCPLAEGESDDSTVFILAVIYTACNGLDRIQAGGSFMDFNHLMLERYMDTAMLNKIKEAFS